MEQLQSISWTLLLALSLSILGFAFGTILLLSKYSSARNMGKLLLSYLIFLGPAFLDEWRSTYYSGVAISMICLFFYVNTFFSQKTRVSYLHLIPIAVVVAMSWFEVFVNPASVMISLYYLFRCIRVLQMESSQRGFNWFQNPGTRLIWFRNFFILNLLVFAGTIAFQNTLFSLVSILLLQSVAIYAIVSESDFFTPIPVANKYKKSSLTPQIKAAILDRIDRVIQEDEFYLRDDASLSNMAEALKVTNHHLSQVLNESMHVSFQDLISQYRIRKACLILKDEAYDQVKIENVATMVGYNSKSAFNTAFKKKTGLTPSEYKERKDVLTYGEERLSDKKEPLPLSSSVDLNHVFSLKIKRDMIQHFLKLFGRNVKRNGLFSFLNVFGLTIGFTCSILIYLFLENELSYDQSLPDAERIYRIAWMSDNPQTRTPHPMAQALVNDFPEIESAVSLSPWYGPGLSKELVRVKNVRRNTLFEEPDFFFADSTFFDVFEIEMVEGDPEALRKPFSLVITESMSRKYFGDSSSAVGRELELNDMPIAVSAVVRPMHKNSHFHFNAIIPYVTLKQINPNDSWMTWADFGHFNYIKLREGVNPTEVESKIPGWIGTYLDWWEDRREEYESSGIGFSLQPIQDIHLTSHLRWELENNGNILYVYILSGTLVFLLLIAAINYMNLTTAKSIERAKEVGVRKTFGATSNRLSLQFYLESVLICIVAMIISIVLALLLLDSFNMLSGKDFSHRSLISMSFLLKAGVFVLIIGVLAGYYPAVALSAFKPTEVLKGKLTSSSRGVRLRSGLVILQFTISALLISGSLIINQQINFMKDKDLGFDQEAVVSLSIPVSIELGGIDLEKVRVVQEQIESIHGVTKTSLISNLPGGQFNQHAYYLKDNPDDRIDASEVMVDFDFEEVLGIEVVQGRTFNPAYSSDTARNFIINEEAVRQLNVEDVVGKKLVWVGNNEEVEGTIIGVVNDFHYRSLHQDIQPLVMTAQPYGAGHIIIKMDGNEFSRIIESVEPIYEILGNELPFEYHFLDKQLATLYTQEEQTLSVFSVFSLIALLLASLGLLGMAIAILNQRIKEVGMRKILGASSSQIMAMILGQFARLVAIALVIGLPLSYFLMQSWLAEFSYRASFGVMPFVWSGLILMVVATVSVLSSVIRITYSNPVDSLRCDS